MRGLIREKGTLRPIAGASITVLSNPGDQAPSGGAVGFVRSDAAGHFRAHLTPGEIAFRLHYGGDFVVPGDLPRDWRVNYPLGTLPAASPED